MFALAAMVAFVVMYDASGIRRAAGFTAERVNALPDSLWTDPPENPQGEPRSQPAAGACRQFDGALGGVAGAGFRWIAAFGRGIRTERVTAAGDLTADQRDAADAFSAWLNSPSDGTPFVLGGFAGSGKTFLSMRLLRQVEETGLCWTVVAPTHKAVGPADLDLEGLQPGIPPRFTGCCG